MSALLNPLTLIRCLAALACILLPGAALLAILPMRGRSFIEQLGAAFGLGLAFIALAALLGRVAGFSFPAPVFLGVGLMCAGVCLAGFLRGRVRFRASLAVAGALLVLAAVFTLRVYQAAALAFPAWVDSVHHALLIRVFLERGGLPADLMPWMPGDFYYHYGFHAAAAVFAALSGLAPDQVLLIFGQVLSALAALSVYRLSMAVRRDPRRALTAMAITGFLTQMPAFYLAWGRYTLLAGMVLLPLAMAEALELAWRAPRPAAAVRLALLTAGVLLTHYLAGLLLAAFLVILGIHVIIRRRRRGWVLFPAIGSIAGALLALPWLIPMLIHAAPGVDVGVVSPLDSVDAVYFTNYVSYLWRLAGPMRNYVIFGIGLAAALFAVRRRGAVRDLALWGLLLGLEALPWGLRVAPFRPDHLIIVLYLPVAVLAADLAFTIIDWLAHSRPAWRVETFGAAVIVAGCVFGGWDTHSLVKPVTVLADSSDREAINWIAVNTPADSVFLINTVYWQSGFYRGVDGGWWIEPLTGRKTLLPPAIYSFADPSFIREVNTLAEQTSTLTGCTPDFYSLLQTNSVNYLYLRTDVGALRPEALQQCPGLGIIFRNSNVTIIRVLIRR